MPTISGIVNAISTSVVSALAAANYPALTDGQILIGRQHIFEQSAPPRVVFIPLTSTFGPRGMRSASNVATNPTNEQMAQWKQRSIATETLRFEVHVWGVDYPNADPEGGDFDATQALYQQVIASTHLITVGSYRVFNGVWTDQQSAATQLVKTGHEFVFGLEFETPVLDTPLGYVPSGTVADSTVILQPADGSTPNSNDKITGL